MKSRWSYALLVLPLSLAAVAACGGPDYVDDDAEYRDARRLPQDLDVADALDFDLGDKADWKSITPMAAGKATVELRVGNIFKGTHELTGEATVYTTEADPRMLAQAIIAPNQVPYDLSWEAEAGQTYLLKVAARGGKAEYTLKLGVVPPAPKDPCADVECDEDERCEAGECVEVEPEVETCDPPCRRNRVCVEGKCVKPCGGRCPRGHYCHKGRNECVKDPCYKKTCPRGEVCRSGACKPKSEPKPATHDCSPACGSEERCVKGRCEAAPLGALSARIVQVLARSGGESSEVVLDKGKAHKVQVGQRGSIRGVGTFRIVEVYEFRSKAVIAKPPAAITGRSATINR